MTSAVISHSADELFGHPKGLYVCFFTEMWERFSFYGMKALLFLYLTKYHLFGDNISYDVIGAYGGLVYCVPVIGGVLADRYLGMRKAVIFGGILLCLGHFGMAFEGHQATSAAGVVTRDTTALMAFYFSLSLIIMGVGFLKPNISTIVGKLYPDNDPRRDSGFNLFFAGINLGALFASLICAYLGETIGWSFGFGAAGVGMLLGLTMFLTGRKYLQGHAEPPNPQKLSERLKLGLTREKIIYACALLGLIPLAVLMWATANARLALGEHVSLSLSLMLLALGVVLVWFFYFISAKCSKVEAIRMLTLMAIIFMCLLFYTLYEQTYGSWVAFTDRLMTKDFFPSLVSAKPIIVWAKNDPLQNLGIFLRNSPWSTYSLLLAPLAFVLADFVSRRQPVWRNHAGGDAFGRA
jgi:proton-dependent oligopeptide transporter, POT family